MAVYNTGIFRNGLAGSTSPDPREMPQEVSREVIKNAVERSTILQLAHVRRMPTLSYRLPALDTKPEAYWLSGASRQAKDTAKKQTTYAEWKNVVMTAEELAVLVPVADAYVADAGIDFLGEIVPEISEAFARAIDGACLFGTNSPFSDSDSDDIYGRAVAAGNDRDIGTSDDIAGDVAELARDLVLQGFNPSGFAVEPGFDWRLSAERTSTGVSPYSPGNGVDGVPARLYGRPMPQGLDGAWDSTRAHLFVGDWTKAIVGMRQDMTVRVMDGVINDDSGAVVYNSLQEDGKILRCVMRLAFCTVAPTTALSSSGYPFAVLRPSGAPAS